jgi:hypothetical protein
MLAHHHALWTWMLLPALIGSTAAPAAAQVDLPPAQIPNLVRPQMFAGFQPIPPDPFGFSPRRRHLVILDARGLQILRFDGTVVFSERPRTDFPEVAFDPSDRRVYLIERHPFFLRLRILDPLRGRVLIDRRLPPHTEVATNRTGTLTLLAVREERQTQVLVLDPLARTTYRHLGGPMLSWGFDPFTPTVALVEDLPTGARSQVTLVHGWSGHRTFLATTRGPHELGFSPWGGSFVLAQPTGSGQFQVQLVATPRGNVLLTRSFAGISNAGFTANGRLVGVRAREGLQERLHLFSTFSGHEVWR